MFLCKTKYKPRIKGVCKIKTLQSQLDSMDAILAQLKSDKDQEKAKQSVDSVKKQMSDTIVKIKSAAKINDKEISQMYDQLLQACDNNMKQLRQVLEIQKNKEEEERMRKIQVYGFFIKTRPFLIIIFNSGGNVEG